MSYTTNGVDEDDRFVADAMDYKDDLKAEQEESEESSMNDKLQAIIDNNESMIYHLQIVLDGMKELNAILEEDDE